MGYSIEIRVAQGMGFAYNQEVAVKMMAYARKTYLIIDSILF